MAFPRRILVTGAGGFVGGHLRAALARLDPAPEVIGTGREGERVDLTVDLRDPVAVDAALAKTRPQAIVHLAAQASVGALKTGESDTWAANLGGTLNLALATARHAPEASVLFVSSSEVYGHAFGPEPIDEEAAPRPAHAYARSKQMAEAVLEAVLAPGATLVVARPFNHTGPGQREDFVLPSFAAQIARIEAGRQPPVLHVGNLDAARDFLDVRDVVGAYVSLLAALPGLPARFTCNVATGAARPVRAVLEDMRRLSRVPFTVEIDPARLRPSDIPYAAGRADRLREATGWRPSIPLEDTLAALLDDARRRVQTAGRS